jgi:type II restriction enzyme
MSLANDIYDKLLNDFKIKEASGKIVFSLNNVDCTIKNNDIVGNVLEEWLNTWLINNGYNVIHNKEQKSPDFWLNREDYESDLLEVKSFFNKPSFDIASFKSYIGDIIERPYRLQADYLIFKYNMNPETGEVSILDIWLKKVWEICAPSQDFPIKVQRKKNVVTNIRPATWFSEHPVYKSFSKMQDFLAAIEESIYQYPDTHKIAEKWKRNLCQSYYKKYNSSLDFPRWYDIKKEYGFDQNE